jgi:dTDP-4-dehydrorhamnose reductase
METMMKILLLGNTGQLGWELNRTLLNLGDLVAMDYPQINMADHNHIRSVVKEHQPDLIINATAYTNVDKAEAESNLAMAINGTGPGILAQEARKRKAALIHYSTDYVFDGTLGRVYMENDHPNPLSVYGQTKLEGEEAAQDTGGAFLIFRTSWVYSLRRPSFVTKVLQWSRNNEVLRIVDDQVSNPTWARSLAESTAFIIAQGKDAVVDYISQNSGLYHLAGGGYCSRYDWAKEILRLDPNQEEQITKEILPAKSTDFPVPAERPLASHLSCDKFERTFNLHCAHWKQDLGLAMTD